LTHGDVIDVGYYTETEQDKRGSPIYNITPKGAIKELFELISFLLTGKTISVVF